MLSEAMKAGGWIEHDGGPCPYADARSVLIQCASGAVGWVTPTNLRWNWEPNETCGSRIIAYKPEATHD